MTLPDSVGFEAGACLGIPAMTAYHAVVLAQAGKGTTLLVSGGAGAVSQYVIQFAKRAGAHGDHHRLLAGESRDGAGGRRRPCIDYKREDVGARVMEITGKRGVDAVIEMDLAANAKLIPGVLRPKGSVIIYGTGGEAALPAPFCLVNSIRLQFFLVYELDAGERARTLAAINDALGTAR